MSQIRPIALTVGEPAGIGPDLVVMLAQQPPTFPIVVLGDRAVLEARAQRLGLPVSFVDWLPEQPVPEGVWPVWHHPVSAPVVAGVLNPANAVQVLALLESATAGCLSGQFSAIVTAPLHKGVINDAGVPFTGHTEWLAERTATPLVVMMLVGAGLRVALATTHLPLRAVADAVTPAHLTAVIRILDADLRQKFGLSAPRILVAGLNPHAGESGHMGREEIEVIEPVLAHLRAEGMTLLGPLPADTLFNPDQLARGDAVLAMYHDQGLPVLKHASFGQGVNVTLGLPIIRTSVDHGTALDLAGRGGAEVGSLRAALALAVDLAVA